MNIEIGTEVELDEIEQKIAKHIAKQRYENNRKKNVTNAKIGNQSNELTDLDGFGAELVFCKLFNRYPDLSIEPRTSKEDQGDAIVQLMQSDVKVDVKCTKYPTGRLITPTWKNKGAVDLYALIVGEFPKYTFKGFMTADELMKDERIGDLGHGKKSYIAEQSELVDLKQLEEELNEREKTEVQRLPNG